MNKPLGTYWCLLICVLLISVTFAVYWPVVNHEFVKYDDDKYVTDNHHVNSGLSWPAVRWAFTMPHFHMWHPLTSLSHILDCQLFGLVPVWHHLTSLLFHLANTLLLFHILKKITGAVWPSVFVAAAFALHPLNVESVAWVAERKNVLSGFFWMLTIAVYISYVKRPCVMKYLLVVLVFGLSIMTKPMVVTLPFVLLLLDYWPLGRLHLQHRDKDKESLSPESVQVGCRERSAWCLILEKIPLFVLTAVLAVITFVVQQRGGVVSGLGKVSLKFRVMNALVSYLAYIRKMVWPSRLAVFYPHPFDKVPMWQMAAAALLLMAVSAWVIWFARSRKYLAVGWLWYLGTLVPVIGLVQVGSQAMADRYAYLTLIGLFIMIAWALSDLLANWPYRKIMLAALVLTTLLSLSICTRLQLRHWRNSAALFERAINVTSNNFVMHNNYANILKHTGRVDEAVEHFYESLRIRPNSAEVHNNLGNALGKLGKIDEEIEHYEKALSLRPGFPAAHYNLATALVRQGKTDEAIAEYREALRFGPRDVDALSNLGFALAGQGKFDEAIEYYKKAIEIEPENIIAHGRLGLALAGVGRVDEALKECRIVLSARPEDAEMHFNVGVLLERQGKIGEAIKEYQQALAINPDYTQAGECLKAALAKQGKRD